MSAHPHSSIIKGIHNEQGHICYDIHGFGIQDLRFVPPVGYLTPETALVRGITEFNSPHKRLSTEALISQIDTTKVTTPTQDDTDEPSSVKAKVQRSEVLATQSR